MRITTNELRKIIKEEVSKLLMEVDINPTVETSTTSSLLDNPEIQDLLKQYGESIKEYFRVLPDIIASDNPGALTPELEKMSNLFHTLTVEKGIDQLTLKDYLKTNKIV